MPELLYVLILILFLFTFAYFVVRHTFNFIRNFVTAINNQEYSDIHKTSNLK